jgi:Tol biopolymer transport system component
MRRLASLIVAALLAGCVPGPSAAVTSPSPSPSPSSTPAPTATASPIPSPTETPGPFNVTSVVGTIPRSFHYFSVGQGESFRILSFDEDRAVPPVVVLTSGRPPVAPGPEVQSDAFSVSADGRIVVVMRRLSPDQTSYFVLRPETGELRTLFTGAGLGPPVVSADGQRIAFARTSDDPAMNGLWLLAVAGAAGPTRLVSDVPQRAAGPPRPLAWSDDASWLAITADLGDGGSQVGVVDPTAGETHFNATTNIFEGGRARVLGPGYAVDWRGGEHSLLITSSRSLFGGRTFIYTIDVGGGPARTLYAPTADVVLGPAVWHPSLDRYSTSEHPVVGGVGMPTAIWVRRLDGTATKVAESPFLSPPWWSRDGTKLFSVTGGDDSTGGISNLLGTGGGTPFCLRGGTVGSCN